MKTKHFHYTSLKNWWHIQDDGGMIPYPITKPELVSVFPELHGIWLWEFDLKGDEHVGSVLWQVMTKNSTKVVKLEVECTEDMLFQSDGRVVSILHDGRLGEWVYHSSVPAVLSATSIPMAQIRLVEGYDVSCLLQQKLTN